MPEKIRIAKKSDAGCILKLFNSDTNLVSNGAYYEKEDIMDYINNKLSKLYLYEINKRTAGAILILSWKTYIYIQAIIVHRDFRGRGVGSKLLKYIESNKKKRQKTIEMFVKEGNKNMLGFISNKGYKKGDKVIYFSKNV